MALPKIELPRVRFTLKAMIEDIERKLRELAAPLNLDRGGRIEEYKGAPGPVEWEEVEPRESPEAVEMEFTVSTRKKFPEKKPEMETKKMHKPRVRKAETRGKAERGKLQKNL